MVCSARQTSATRSVPSEPIDTVGFCRDTLRRLDTTRPASILAELLGVEQQRADLELLYGDRDREELSSEDSAMLSALMSIDNVELPPAHALEFLGG